MRNSNTTIGSLMKEIGSLLFVLGRLIISYLEEWVRVFLNLAISKPVPSEQEESIQRAIHFADGFHDGDWERDMEQEYIEEEVNEHYNTQWNGGSTNTGSVTYDGVMDTIED